MIILPNDYKETLSPHSSLSNLSQNTASFSEVKNFVCGSNAPLNDKWKNHEASSKTLSTIEHDSKNPQKNSAPDSLETPQRTHNNLPDLAFLTWYLMLPTLKLSLKPDLL